jgi:hypothetical protein
VYSWCLTRRSTRTPRARGFACAAGRRLPWYVRPHGECPMKRHLITVAILIAALACYGFGFSRLGLAAVIAGGALELWFWVRLFSRRAPVRGHSSPPAK